jgi:hypothetical protein
MAEKDPQAPKESELLNLPPQNIAAEESLLSAILVDNTALREVVEVLAPADFYRTAHQKIFAAISDLFNRGADRPGDSGPASRKRASSNRWAERPTWPASWTPCPWPSTLSTTPGSFTTRPCCGG